MSLNNNSINSFNLFFATPYGDSGSPAKSVSEVGMTFGSPKIVPPDEEKTNFLQPVSRSVLISLRGCKILCSKSHIGSSTDITTDACAAK